MKKQTMVLLVAVFAIPLACRALSPTPTPRDGTVVTDCSEIVAAVRNIQPGDIPQNLMDTGTKQGDEFDANEYFSILTHVSMQDGYLLDYVYPVPDLGAYPILYARPEGQPPYASVADIPEGTDLPDFRDHLEIEDAAQGYFEYVVMDIMAGQFYLFWHANYNDTEIVCDSGDVDAIVEDMSSGDFGYAMDAAQQRQARAMKNIEPLVKLSGDTAIVELIVFTKWGGFYRQTYTINRSFPHTIIDVEGENLVPYDCGIMF